MDHKIRYFFKTQLPDFIKPFFLCVNKTLLL